MKKSFFAFIFFIFTNSCGTFEHKQPKLVVPQSPSKNSSSLSASNDRKKETSCGHIFLIVPIKKVQPIDELTEKVIKQGVNSNALKDVEVKTTNIFTFIYNVTCVEVSGVPVNFSGELL